MISPSKAWITITAPLMNTRRTGLRNSCCCIHKHFFRTHNNPWALFCESQNTTIYRFARVLTMAEKGKTNIEHVDGVGRLREEQEKVILVVDTKYFCLQGKPCDPADTVSYWPRGWFSGVCGPRVGLMSHFLLKMSSHKPSFMSHAYKLFFSIAATHMSKFLFNIGSSCFEFGFVSLLVLRVT